MNLVVDQQKHIKNLQFSVLRFDWKQLLFKDMMWKYENYSEKNQTS